MKNKIKKRISLIAENSKAFCIGCLVLSALSFIGIGMLDIPRLDYEFALDELTYTFYNFLSMVFFFSLVLACFLGGYYIGKPKPKVLEMEN